MNFKGGYVHKGDQPKFKLRNYVTSQLPAPPREWSWSNGLTSDPGMFGNGPDPTYPQYPDGVGDCTCADPANAIASNTANGDGPQSNLSTASVVDFYFGITGGPDSGLSLTQVSQALMTKGLIGNKILGYVDIDDTDNPTKILRIKQAIWLFGGCPAGFMWPQSAMDSFGKGGILSNIKDTKILGGHDAISLDFNDEGPILHCWNMQQAATWAWMLHYGVEFQPRLWQDWIAPSVNLAPNGLALDQLKADLAVTT